MIGSTKQSRNVEMYFQKARNNVYESILHVYCCAFLKFNRFWKHYPLNIVHSLHLKYFNWKEKWKSKV